MGFELFIKPKMGTSLGKDVVSVGRTTMTFGENIGNNFTKGDFVSIYIDYENNLVGIKNNYESQNSFKVSQRKRGCSNKFITCESVCKFISKGKYLAYKDGDKIVFSVRDIAKPTHNHGGTKCS